MTIIHQKAKIILIAILATISFALFNQHISADTYTLSGTITDVNYDSGSITIAPDDNSNYTDIKGFSGNQLKSIAKTINNKHHKHDVYDFKLKNKNQIISYKLNATKTKNNTSFHTLLEALAELGPYVTFMVIFMVIVFVIGLVAMISTMLM